MFIPALAETLASLAGLLAAAALSAGTAHAGRFVFAPFFAAAFLLGLRRLAKLRAEEAAAAGPPPLVLTRAELRARTFPDRLYLGEGFPWEKEQAAALYRVLEKDPALCRAPRDASRRGSGFIQRLGRAEDVYLPLGFFDGHTLITGTTGAGKTRLYDLLCAQAVFRGEGVVVIDPKGDRDLYENIRAAAAACGREVLFFHPAFPDRSIRLNPLHSFSRATELAARLSSLVPVARGKSDPFRGFAFAALNAVIGGIVETGRRPTLKLIRYYIGSRLTELALLAFRCAFDRCLGDSSPAGEEWAALRKETSKYPGRLLAKYEALYLKAMKPYRKRASEALEALAELARHDSDHYKKMTASLRPVLEMLTAGELGSLLSPAEDDDLGRRTRSLAEIVRGNMILYAGLDSLTDGQTGAALGSLLLADLAAVAGARYNFGKDPGAVNLFVDETAEVINDQLIQLLNKGRGAKFRITVATQTIADFEAGLGSPARALQALGNVNNLISLRTIDRDTREYVSASLPKTRVLFRSESAARSQDSESLTAVKTLVSDGFAETEAAVFPPETLAELPDLEYIARVGGATVIKGRIPFLKPE